MKIAASGDWHLNKLIKNAVMDKDYPDVTFRAADMMRAADWAVTQIIEEIKPDLFVHTGDVYDSHLPSNTVTGFFSSQLKRLSDAKIPVVILLGNHDVCMKNHALMPVSQLKLKTVKVVERSTFLEFKGMNLLLFPYSLDIEQKLATTREAFHDFIKNAKEKDIKNGIFFGHLGVQGAKINEFTELTLEDIVSEESEKTVNSETKDYINKNPRDVGVSEFNNLPIEYAILGDYHEFQKVESSKKIMYSGSIERSSMAEANQRKGFLVYDTDAKEDAMIGKCKFVEYPNCRPMLELKGTLDQMKESFDKIDHGSYQNSMIKMSFAGDAKQLTDYSYGKDEFRKLVNEKIRPIHWLTKQSVFNDEIKAMVTKVESAILEKGQMSKEDVMIVVREDLAEKIKDETELIETEKIADEIYKEVIESLK